MIKLPTAHYLRPADSNKNPPNLFVGSRQSIKRLKLERRILLQVKMTLTMGNAQRTLAAFV